MPPPATALVLPELMIVAMKTRTLMTIRLIVTVPALASRPPPNAVRTGRCVRAPSQTHSGHWKPTDASFMQSGQIGRSQRGAPDVRLAVWVPVAVGGTDGRPAAESC